MPISWFDEFTADIAENRYLRAGIRRALKVPRIAAAEHRRLLRQLAQLEEVADVPVDASDLDAITITRLSAHYEPSDRQRLRLLPAPRLRHGAQPPEGVLIYCLDEGGTPEASVTVRHAGTVLHTKAFKPLGIA